MGEEGLDAIRSIRQVINNQDEKIWRLAAHEKYMKKETEKLLTECKQYEIQIEALKPQSPYRSTKNVSILVKNAIDHEIQTHKLLLIAIESKKTETEIKKRDLKLWEERYSAVIDDFKKSYEERKSFYELHNQNYKLLKQSEVGKTLALIEVKWLNAEIESAKRIAIELSNIKRQLLYTKVIDFVKAISRQKQTVELNLKLNRTIAKKRELGSIMLEMQKAWKKQNSINIQRRNDNVFPDMMQVPKIDFSKREASFNKKVTQSAEKTPNDRSNVKNTPATKKTKTILPNNEQPKQSCDNIIVIENKKLSLPPLKSILNDSRSNLKREKLSQESNFSENRQLLNKCIASKKVDNTLKEMKVFDKNATNVSSSPKAALNMSLERLKNVKLITKQPQNIDSISRMKLYRSEETQNQQNAGNISPMKFSLKNRHSAEIPYQQKTQPQNLGHTSPVKFCLKNRHSEENQNCNKAHVNNTDSLKRKMDSEKLNDEMVVPAAKKDRSVSFASPIEKYCNDMMMCSPNEKLDIEATLQSSISLTEFNIAEETEAVEGESFEDNYSRIMTKPFNFTNSDGSKVIESNNAGPLPVTSPPSMFDDIVTTRPTFSFTFGRGVLESTNIWDSFK